MKIRIVSFSDQGGAGIAARRIAEALYHKGADVKLLMARTSSPAPYITLLKRDRIADNKLVRRWRNQKADRILKKVHGSRPIEHDVFTVPWGDYDKDLARQTADADVVHLHWVAGLTKLSTLTKSMSSTAVLVWTLHDMNPITGGYHYQEVIDPSIMTRWEQKVIRERARTLQSIHHRVVCCAPSQWLTSLAANSPVFNGARSKVMRNCIDLTTFFPRDKDAMKKQYGLDLELPTLLFVNHNNDDPNKGLGLLKESIHKLREQGRKFQVVTVGKHGESSELTIHLGSISDPNKMAEIYSAADAYVIPSAMDNYPNTVIEAFACGIPAIGFSTGGIPEQIIDGETGFLIQDRSSDTLATAIDRMIQSPQSFTKMSTNCLNYIHKNNAPEIVAETHLQLYNDALTGKDF